MQGLDRKKGAPLLRIRPPFLGAGMGWAVGGGFSGHILPSLSHNHFRTLFPTTVCKQRGREAGDISDPVHVAILGYFCHQDPRLFIKLLGRECQSGRGYEKVSCAPTKPVLAGEQDGP